MKFLTELAIAIVMTIGLFIAAVVFLVYIGIHRLLTGKEPDTGRMFERF